MPSTWICSPAAPARAPRPPAWRRGGPPAGARVLQLNRLEGYVRAVVHALEVDLLDRRVGPRPRLDDGRSGPDHVEDPAPRGVEPAVLLLGRRVVDVDAGGDVLQARDLVPRMGRIRGSPGGGAGAGRRG